MLSIRTNAKDVARQIERQGQALTRALDRAAKLAAAETEADMKRRAPRRTGQLQRSIKTQRLGEAHYQTGPTAPYAEEVITGRYKPMPVTAANIDQVTRWLRTRSRKPLDSRVERLIAVKILRRMNHRGARPNPFVEETAKAMGPRVEQIFEKAIQESMG